MTLPWPLPALLAWAAAWGVFLGGLRLSGSAAASIVAACVAGLALGLRAPTRWRRVLVAAGFPLSFAVCGLAAGMAHWAWLAPLAVLLPVYPLRTWGDAPVFPTPAGALRGLARQAPLAPGARILDAGCGLGNALVELHREYPQARIEGIEWSRPLRLVCAWRARFADVRRADLWAADWSGCDLVYVFQRPDTMERIGRKARAEMAPGAWLVSLEFEVPGWVAQAQWEGQGRRVWVHRVPMRGHR
jgi:SAM-dependent methyltransferase